jgi:hypothetical protein
MTVFIYVDNRKHFGDTDRLKVFANQSAAERWFQENDPERRRVRIWGYGVDTVRLVELGLKTMKEVYLYLLSAALVISGLVLAIMSWRERRRDVLYGRYIDPNEAKDERET